MATRKTTAKTKPTTPSFIHKGALPPKGESNSNFLPVKPDEALTVVPLHNMDDMLSLQLHSWWDINPAPHLVCLGENCPSCQLGHEPVFKAYFGVATRDKEAKILPMGISIVRALEELEPEFKDTKFGGLKGIVIKIKRTGKGLGTKYSVLSTGKSVDVSGVEPVDIVAQLGPLEYDEQVKVLKKAGVNVSALGVEVEDEEEETGETASDEVDEILGDDDDFDGWAEV